MLFKQLWFNFIFGALNYFIVCQVHFCWNKIMRYLIRITKILISIFNEKIKLIALWFLFYEIDIYYFNSFQKFMNLEILNSLILGLKVLLERLKVIFYTYVLNILLIFVNLSIISYQDMLQIKFLNILKVKVKSIVIRHYLNFL